MKIKLKTFIIIGVSAICAVLLMTFTVRLLLIHNLLYEEDKLLNHQFKKLVTMLNKEKSAMEMIAEDWSKCEDTYLFIKNSNQKYIHDNLDNYTLSNLKLDVTIFTDDKGKIVYSHGYDFDKSEEIAISPETINEITEGAADIYSGMLIVSGKPMIIVSLPINSPYEKGSVNGHLIIARYIGTNYLNYLENITEQCIVINRLNPADKENIFKNKVQNQNPDINTMVIKKDSTTITGYALLKDINGNPNIIITTRMQRDIYIRGIKQLQLFIFVFLIGISLITLVSVIVLNKTLVARLKRLLFFLQEVEKTQDISSRIELKGKDEIAELALSTNHLLYKIEEAYKAIDDQKKSEDVLRESARNYRKIVNLCPEVMVIIVDGIIVLANKLTFQYFDNPIGENIESFATPDFAGIMKKRVRQILENKIEKTTFDYTLVLRDNCLMDVEVVSSYFNYKGKPAILSLIRKISERKKELTSAANFQKQALKNIFPVPHKAEIETLYIPSKTVSGDFYFFHKIDKNRVIGILGDVSGNGVSAALSISAFNVLFHEAVLITPDPSKVINVLNKKIASYLGERYIAACCFSFDFKKNEAKIVGAGISEFIFHTYTGKYVKKEVKGPFLGMFKDSVFDEEVIHIQSGDRFYFYTDGLDFIFSDDPSDENFFKTAATTPFIHYLNNTLKDMLTNVEGIKDDCIFIAEGIKDDCTLIALEIK